MAEPRDRGEYRPPNSPVAGIPRDDAEPASGKVTSLAFVSLPHRERTDDAEPGDPGEDLGSAQRRSEPLLHPGIEWRSAARGSLHSGTPAIPPPTRLGAMAGNTEEAAGHQRSRFHKWSDAHHASGCAEAALAACATTAIGSDGSSLGALSQKSWLVRAKETDGRLWLRVSWIQDSWATVRRSKLQGAGSAKVAGSALFCPR